MTKPTKTINVYLDNCLILDLWDYRSIEKFLSGLLTCNSSINTNCTDFFCFDTLDKGWNVVVYQRNHSIDLYDLLNVPGKYTKKEIRKEHNARKLLMSGALKFIGE